MTKIRIGVVGCGNAGTTLHLPALAGIGWAEVVGAADLDATRRSQTADRFRVPVFASLEAVLAETHPDVVIIGTLPHTHAELCLQAINAGCDVICEKPFVSTLDEADRLIAAADAAGKRIALNHEFREMPIFRAVRDAAAKQPGGVVFAQAWQNMDLPPWAEPGWRGEVLTQTLYEAGIHLVDFLMALFGEKPVSVTANVSTCGVREEESDAVALVTMEFSRGRLAQVVQNRLCKGETQFFEVRAETLGTSLRASFGGRARLSAGLLRNTRPHLRVEYGVSGLAWREEGAARSVIAKNPKDPAMIATRVLLEKTLVAFRDGGRPPASAQDGRDVMEVIAACYRSAASGRRVELSSAPAAAELQSAGAGSRSP
ncbi:MAG TPA: Gfo/Idh/MocA family oxidoreductase [Gemmatimonadaceae bacterium]|nr:Gfo/Idh/MocA family oxidoreductase [Gemmatimonadaceae bacterium]